MEGAAALTARPSDVAAKALRMRMSMKAPNLRRRGGN